jgi:RNA polymerase II subunit A C-terminal domain phosphatase
VWLIRRPCDGEVADAFAVVEKFDSANMKRQLEKQKLSLVLDLDHTLLHAVRVEDLTSEIAKAGTLSSHAMVPSVHSQRTHRRGTLVDDIHYFFIPGLPSQHVVKLRPGLTAFLEELSATYDLFIYTHGTRTYAEEIAKIIDPNGTFFQHRIVARTDTPDMLHKSLKLLFPSCDDSMILVLDDRIDVWKVSSSFIGSRGH